MKKEAEIYSETFIFPYKAEWRHMRQVCDYELHYIMQGNFSCVI